MKLTRLLVSVALATLTIFNTIYAAPAAPANARPAWVDGFSVVLTWDEVPEAAAFRVYRYDASTAQWVTVGSDLLAPMFSEVPPHEPPLQYAITALNAEGESSAAIVSLDASGFASTSATITPPGWHPDTLTETNAVIRFYVSIVSGTDGLLEIGTNPSALEFWEYQPEYAGGHNFTLTNLLPGTEYFYRLTLSETSRLGLTYLSSFVTFPMNQPPTAQNVNMQQPGPWEAAVPLSGSDPESWQTLTARITTVPTKGTITALVETGPGSWTAYYQPNPSARGTDTFQYVVSDGQLDSAPATVTITEIYMNEAPVATDSQVTTSEDTPVQIVLSATDADGDVLTFTVEYVSDGELSGNPPNLTWTPPANFNGTAWISFRVSDGVLNGFGTVEIIVSAVNDAPIANAQSHLFFEDSTKWLTLSATDAENSPVTFQIVTPPQHGTLSGSGATRLYRPGTNYFGTDSFQYRAFDGQLYSAAATVSLEVLAVNDEPVPISQFLSVAEDGSIAGVMSAYDAENDPVDIRPVSFPQHGTLTGSGTNFVYTPSPNYTGPDGFSFSVSGFLGASFGRIDFNVTPVNDAPAAVNLNFPGQEDSTISAPLSGTDVDGDALSYTVVSQPSHGTLSGNAPNLVYMPNANFNGADSFTYRVSDGTLESAVASVSISVVGQNDAPTGSNSSVGTLEDTEVLCVLNASDVEGDSLTLAVVRAPTNGALTPMEGNSVRYQPNSNFHGNDSFDVQVSDGSVTGNVFTVSITVQAVNDAPFAQNQTASGNEDSALTVLLGGTDIDGDVIGFVVATQPEHGTLSGVVPNLTYTPAANYNGPDSFMYLVSDGQVSSEVATVNINVLPVNDAPSGSNSSVTTLEDTEVACALVATDVDGDLMSFVVARAPENGVLGPIVGSSVTYTPNVHFNGVDTFDVRVSDGSEPGNVFTVTVNVQPVNDPPSANGTAVSTSYNTPLPITLTGTDVEGNSLGFSIVTPPANGSLSGTGSNVTFTPLIGWSGTTSFTFKVNDGEFDSAPATVLITVAPAAAVPAAPGGLTATGVSRSQINLAWNDNSNNEDGFRIERTSSGSSWTEIGTVGPNVTTFFSAGLSANKNYSYRVRAFNMRGNSAYSNTASAKTLR